MDDLVRVWSGLIGRLTGPLRVIGPRDVVRWQRHRRAHLLLVAPDDCARLDALGATTGRVLRSVWMELAPPAVPPSRAAKRRPALRMDAYAVGNRPAGPSAGCPACRSLRRTRVRHDVAGPLIVFQRQLWRMKLQGTFDYGLLATRVARRFESRWLKGSRALAEDVLDTRDLSATTDLFGVVANVRQSRSEERFSRRLRAGQRTAPSAH